MGFFYQALKKETGVKTDNQEETSFELDRVEERSVVASQAQTPPRARRHTFELQHPVENLVAFLAPPVVEENILAMEQCRVLRTRVREVMLSRKMKTLLLTSALPAEGKTFLSVNLAFALSHIENARVLLVDVDLRRPSVDKFLKMNAEKGLLTFLRNESVFDDVCWELSPTLDVVPTLEVAENSAELLHGARMLEFIELAKQQYDVVIMDGPPLFPIVDAQVLAPLVDAALLVVRAGQTPFDLSRQAVDLLKSKFIGSVLNGAETMASSSYYGGYYSHYGVKGNKNKSKK